MKLIRALALAAAAAAMLFSTASRLAAQQIKLDLDRLAAKASDSVDLSLNGSTLQFAAKFLDSKDPDEAKVKQLIASLEGIYIRNYEFAKAGEWSQADLEPIRKQLQAPEWSKIVGVKSTQEGETEEIYVRTVDKKITGVTILVAEPKELTVVNIAGPVDLDSLADLGGHLGIPKVVLGKQK